VAQEEYEANRSLDETHPQRESYRCGQAEEALQGFATVGSCESTEEDAGYSE
jgi:hypothetical protein